MASRAAPSTATTEPVAGDYPDSLDAGLLRIAGVCVLASVMAILDATVVSVAQRTFIVEFGSTQAVVAWTITGYTLAQVAVIPLAGWAADRFGTKRLFLGATLWFTLASLLCSMASNIVELIAFRMIQGLGSGILVPLVMIILTREAGPRRLGRLMAVLGIPMLLGPMGGPVLGGWLIGAYGWQWIFRINLPVGLIVLVLAAAVFPRDRPRPSEAFDFVGMLLLSPGLAALLFGISSVPRTGTLTDNHVWIPVLIGLTLITAFVVHALQRADHPLIDLRLFENRVVTFANSAMFMFSIGFFGIVLLLPSYFQQLLHQTPLQSGVHMVPQGLGAMLAMPLAGTLMDKRGVRNVLLVGITLITIGRIRLWRMGTSGLPADPAGGTDRCRHGPGLHHDAAVRGGGTGVGAPSGGARIHPAQRQSARRHFGEHRIDVGDLDQPVQPKRNHHRRREARDPAWQAR
jgi:MFS transporter, DHA2 family, multidrug resistance protein